MDFLAICFCVIGSVLILTSLLIGIFLPREKRAKFGGTIFLIGAVLDALAVWRFFQLGWTFLAYMIMLVGISTLLMFIVNYLWLKLVKKVSSNSCTHYVDHEN